MNGLSIFMCAFGIYYSSAAFSSDSLKINEFMASNIHAQLLPDYADFEDWIEIYNAGNTPAYLSNLYLTDDFSSPLKWKFPEDAVVQPKSFYIVWADALNKGNHASFKLSKAGEQIGLYHADGTIIDTVTFCSLPDDISCGRFPDGTGTLQYFIQPTCNSPNTAPGLTGNNQAARPSFSPEGGLFIGPQLVTITAGAGTTIRYTTDGSLPTLQSNIYSQPIPVDSTMVLRAGSFHDTTLPSETITHTYVINEPSTIPVIAITTPPEFLFDEEIGITVGKCVSDTIGAEPPFDTTANYWNKWERPVHIEFFEPDGDRAFMQDAGIAIFGGLFGRQIRQKAFTVYARDKYGNPDFDYPLFPSKSINSYKRFLLRCSSNDFNSTYIRDAMMNTLVIGQMDIDYQAYQPAMVYINGNFWGLYNIREKMNQFYPESHYGIDADSVDLMEGMGTAAHGDNIYYEQLMDYVETHDMTIPESYQHIQSLMDIGEYMNYFITEIYVCNRDWLHQNIKYWREHSIGGKWRWLLYDLDWGFCGQDPRFPGLVEVNMFQWIIDQGWASYLFQRLMLNKEFRDEFTQRFATHLNLTFNPERVHRIIDSLVHRIEPEMPRQIARWGAIRNMEYWHEQLLRLHEFAQERQRIVFQHLDQTVDPGEKAELILEVSDPSSGWISVDEAPVPVPAFSGPWYKNIPLRISAHSRTGWRFVRWEGTFPSDTSTNTIVLSENSIMLAVFEPFTLPPVVISEIHYNPSMDLQGEDDLYEFVELVNTEKVMVDISGFRFINGIHMIFPQGSYMQAGECIVIAKTAAVYKDRGYQVFQVDSGRLDNAGEELILADKEGMKVDQVLYDDHFPWPESPDGHGPSLELSDPLLDNNIASSWKASDQTGGTPGKNSITRIDEQCLVPENNEPLKAYPNPFHHAISFIYTVPPDGHARIVIYSLQGCELEILANGSQKQGWHEINWNPGNLPGGIYLVHYLSDTMQQIIKIVYHKGDGE
jgi:hypothetical protein